MSSANPNQAERELTRVLRHAHAWMDARPTHYPPAGVATTDIVRWATWCTFDDRTSIYGHAL